MTTKYSRPKQVVSISLFFFAVLFGFKPWSKDSPSIVEYFQSLDFIALFVGTVAGYIVFYIMPKWLDRES